MINRRLNLGFPDVPWGDIWFTSPMNIPVEDVVPFPEWNEWKRKRKQERISPRSAGPEGESVSRVVGLLPEFRGTPVEQRKHATLYSFEHPSVSTTTISREETP